MNLSLINDVLDRNAFRSENGFSPPNCFSDFIEHPYHKLRHNKCITVGVTMEHRFAFFYWAQVKENIANYYRYKGLNVDSKKVPSPDLITFDWHNDVGIPEDFIEEELRRLNLSDSLELGLFCWAGLKTLNDGHILPAVWLNIIGDVYVLYKQDKSNSFTTLDCFENEHNIHFFNDVSSLHLQWQKSQSCNGIIWDLDMDFFTNEVEIPGQRYSNMMSDESISNFLETKNKWIEDFLENLEMITIALEPKYTGGLTNSLHLFRQWEKSIFEKPILNKKSKFKPLINS